MSNQSSVEKSIVSVRNSHIYIEDYNHLNKESMLYLHGGPGASCIDFCYNQAEKLSKYLRVVAIDQRGVLRSDPIAEDEKFGIYEIIEDCEALREKLGIHRWTVLGHSFGGYVAFKYSLLYPKAIKKIIFEAPAFDIESSLKSLIQKALNIFKINNNHEGIEECDNCLNATLMTKDLWNIWLKIGQILGKDRDHIYFYGISPDVYNDIIEKLVPSKDLWDKCQRHIEKLVEEGAFFKSLIPDLDKLSHSSLLITGLFDPVCCEEQRIAYKQNTKNSLLKLFENSGHFLRMEEPEKYTNTILEFLFDKK